MHVHVGTGEMGKEVNDINQKIWFELHNDSTVTETTTIVISSTEGSSPETTPTNIDRRNTSEHIDESDTLDECSSNTKLGKGKGPVNKRFKRKGQQHVIVDLTLSPNNSEQGSSTFDAIPKHELIPVEESVHAVCDDDSAETSTKRLPEFDLTEDGNFHDSFVECTQQQQITKACSGEEVYSTERKPTKLLHDAGNICSCSTEILKAELVSIDKELKAAKNILMNAVLEERDRMRDS